MYYDISQDESHQPQQTTKAISHHQRHHEEYRCNYGLYFRFWDRWCGTEDPDYLRHGDARFGKASYSLRITPPPDTLTCVPPAPWFAQTAHSTW